MLHNGDCLEILKTLSENSVDSLVTDPPAGIGFMGKEWDHHKGGRKEWCAWMESVMAECLRVLKPGGHGLVWAIPRTSHWTATALEDAGFEIRDRIQHIFGSGFPKSMDISKAIDKAAGADRAIVGEKTFADGSKARKTQNLGGNSFQDPASRASNLVVTAPSTEAAKQWQGWGTALKPATEDWWLVRKPISEKTVAANVQKWGTGALNIDASRIAGKYSNQGGGSFATGQFKNSNRSNTEKDGAGYIEAAPTQGRFPANLVLSHSDYCTDEMCDLECPVSLLDEQSGITKSGGGVKNPVGGVLSLKKSSNHTASPPYSGDKGGASRFFYCAKTSSSERNAGLDGFEERKAGTFDCTASGGNKLGRKGKEPTAPAKNHHPTVKPKKLMGYLIRMITPPGGAVLDPFMGSGSTGVAAKELGFKFIGIEKEQEYFEISKARVTNA